MYVHVEIVHKSQKLDASNDEFDGFVVCPYVSDLRTAFLDD